MEIKFIDEKGNNIDIKNIYLSANNPRYTLIDNLNVNLVDFITSGDYTDQKKIFKKLLESEGNFEELFRLLNSIYQRDFDNTNEPIYLVKKDNNYIVAEGNRRLMCLKLINGDFYLPELIDKNDQNYSNPLSEYMEEIDDKTLDNYGECKKTLKLIQDKYKVINVNCEVTIDDKKLWSQIYDRHLAGNRPGMREWSRSKYFADLLSIFKYGLKSRDENTVISKFSREWKRIITDFKEAQYIYSCFYFNKINISDETPNFQNLDDDILETMITSSRISALERTHSFNKVKKIICEDILFCNDNEFKENYLKIDFEKENYRIKFITNNNFNYQKLLSWIYEKWQDKKITTREFKKNEINDLISELKFNIFWNIDLNDHLNSEELDKLDEFNLSIDQLEKVILANSGYHNKDKIYRFELAKQIIEENNKFIDNLKVERNYIDIEPINVFEILKRQLEHNNKNREIYLNAICATLRSLLEQILRWLNFIDLNDEQYDKLIEKISSVDSNCYLRFDTSIKKYKIDDNEINDVRVAKWLEESLKDKSKIDEYKKEIFRLINKEDSNFSIRTLNNNIHALHKIYLLKNYNDKLKEISEIQTFILNLILNIDFGNKHFDKLNKKIIKFIREKYY